MLIKQKQLLEKLDNAFIGKMMEIAVRESHEQGGFLFHQGDPADHMYILIKGKIKLVIEKTDHAVFTVNHPGDIFGWSSILGRDAYSVSAVCMEKSILRKIQQKELSNLLENNKGDAVLFYRKIAEMLGNRLLHSYTLTSQLEFPQTLGTGQLQEMIDAA